MPSEGATRGCSGPQRAAGNCGWLQRAEEGHGGPLKAAGSLGGLRGASASLRDYWAPFVGFWSPVFHNEIVIHCIFLKVCFCFRFGHWGNPWLMPLRVATWVYDDMVYQPWDC
jgi:hypothetical protein